MKYTIENVVRQSDLVEFSWEGCGRIRTYEGIIDETEQKAVACCMRKTKKGLWDNLQYSYDFPIVFYKKINNGSVNSFVAWIKFEKGKWERLL